MGLPVFYYQSDKHLSASDMDFGGKGFKDVTKLKSRVVLQILRLGGNLPSFVTLTGHKVTMSHGLTRISSGCKIRSQGCGTWLQTLLCRAMPHFQRRKRPMDDFVSIGLTGLPAICLTNCVQWLLSSAFEPNNCRSNGSHRQSCCSVHSVRTAIVLHHSLWRRRWQNPFWH